MDIFEFSKKRSSYFSELPSGLPDPNKVSVAFSGGIDSVYLLHRFLTETSHNIFAFFYVRSVTETFHLPAVKNIIERLQKIRKFDFDVIESFEYRKRPHVYVPRYVQIYQDSVRTLYAQGIDNLYIGWSVSDTEYVEGDFLRSLWWTEARKFFNDKYDISPSYWEVRDYWDLFGGGINWRMNFVHEIGKVYQKYYNLSWHPQLELTPTAWQVSREAQYEVLDHDLLEMLVMECGHSLAESRELQYFCPCHLHHYTLHKLGIR